MAKGGFIACKIDRHSISKAVESRIEQEKAKIIKSLAYIGEQCVKIARERGSYEDVTGNLRSSIGYVVLQDGSPVVQGAPERFSGPKGDGAQGAAAAQELLSRVQADFPAGIALIVCAGMKYAAYVEELYHKDVLASAELAAPALVKQVLGKLID